MKSFNGVHQNRFAGKLKKLFGDVGSHSFTGTSSNNQCITIHKPDFDPLGLGVLLLCIKESFNAPLWCFCKLFIMNPEFVYCHEIRQTVIHCLSCLFKD